MREEHEFLPICFVLLFDTTRISFFKIVPFHFPPIHSYKYLVSEVIILNFGWKEVREFCHIFSQLRLLNTWGILFGSWDI